MSKDIKILIVGGAGYIGSGITDLLKNRGFKFTVYDNLLYERHYLKPVDFIYGDVRDRKKLSRILKDYTHVIWLAAIVGDSACAINPGATVAINQKSVQWLSKNFNGRIIFPSTCSIYGQNKEIVNEESPLNPLSLYARTKIKAESYLINTDALILRLGTVYGVSDTHSRIRADLVVNYMPITALTKGEITVFNGKQWRPLIHVKDVAEAIIHNLDRPVHGIYNLATSNYNIKDLAKVVAKQTKAKIKYANQKFEDERGYRVSLTKMKKDSIIPPIKIRNITYGVKEIVALIKSGRIANIEDTIYSNHKYLLEIKI